MEIRKLNAARGWLWVKHSYQLIMHNPLLMLLLGMFFAFALFFTLRIPMIGPLLCVFLLPTLLVGYMRVCRALEENEKVELKHLLAGFGKHAARLVALGALLLLGVVICSVVMLILGGPALATLMGNANVANDPQILMTALQSAGSGVALSITVGFALMFVLFFAFQYAPMLVYFNELSPLVALRASLSGSLRNLIPYTVYSLVMQVVALVLSSLPYNVGLVLWIPLVLTSLYVGYRNIFPFADEIVSNQSRAPDTTA